ncbi:hypothetical protein HA62_23550, partial [Pseudomonas putida]
MPVQIFIGNADGDNESKLQEIRDRMDPTGQSAPIVQAEAYGEEGLVQIIEVRASGGQREILIDGCSRA